jgi:hypothetical protein
MMYFITPNYSVALIPKAGCSTLSRCVIKAFQPHEENQIVNGAYPEGQGPDTTMWQGFVKKQRYPTMPTLALIREPVSRFCSAMAQIGLLDVDAALDSMLNGTPIQKQTPRFTRTIFLNKNHHFLPQIKWVHPDTKLYRFPDHLNEAATEIGFALPLPAINIASRPKPTLTTEQEDAVRAFYAEDITLYNSIIQPGIVTGIVTDGYTPPVPPTENEEPPVYE